MSDTNQPIDIPGIEKSEDIPMEELLNKVKANTTPVKHEKPSTPKEENDTKPTVKTGEYVNQQLSPLEQLKEQKASSKGRGLVISNEALEAGMDHPVKSPVMREERLTEFKEAIDEADQFQWKRDHVTLIKAPTTQIEYTELIMEMDYVVLDPATGKAKINAVDKYGNPIELKYIRLREEGDPPFDMSKLPKVSQAGVILSDTNDDETGENGDPEEEQSEDDAKKKKIVDVLIDRTGFGIDFLFNDEEKSKLEKADVIRVNQVNLIDINMVLAKKSEKTLQQTLSQYDITGSRTTICFPASGFKAQMKGLTYGEYSDIALSMESITQDQYNRKLSIIYNNMTNISTGPFESYDDFLRHFAFTDIPLATYAMYVSTEPETLEIPLSCGNKEVCGRDFNWKFNVRSLLRLDQCPDVFLEKMKEIATSPASEYERIKNESAVDNIAAIELPYSKFIVEVGIISAYDFLHNFVPLQDENVFKEAFGEDGLEVYQSYFPLLSSVHAVHVPDGDGGYVDCYGYKDIMHALYQTDTKDIPYLAAYTEKIQSQYFSTFSLGNVVCPHCHRKTPNLEIDIDDLVFQTYRQRMNTTIDFTTL